MKYMIMMHTGQDATEGIANWSQQDVKRHLEFQHDFDRELREAGEMVFNEGLTFPDQARIVRHDGKGAPAVTDGPFPEAKEFLIGFWIVDCAGPERAYEIAAKASSAPGKDGQPLGIPIEVRPIVGPPTADA
ncbi:YciI family protein [Catellatospora sp. NPDC049111]|uniref:YciI family protein n=1 Tax=Catellatospora sp. NPDC049111 TaxID=3155271 RepID=UPI0033F8FE07